MTIYQLALVRNYWSSSDDVHYFIISFYCGVCMNLYIYIHTCVCVHLEAPESITSEIYHAIVIHRDTLGFATGPLPPQKKKKKQP